ncbi:hypothetical protein K492DRAFT_188524 [Lichtheimia hyalospora FSU 10163]|nr:hypothetical protein K492DRAFT_188524 [Lichtheimia hyalospora FSU 10163]
MRFDCIAIYALFSTAFLSTSIAVQPHLTFSKRVLDSPDLSVKKVAGQLIPVINSQGQAGASLLYQVSKIIDEDTTFENSQKPAPPKPATPPMTDVASPKEDTATPKKGTAPPEKDNKKSDKKGDDETT